MPDSHRFQRGSGTVARRLEHQTHKSLSTFPVYQDEILCTQAVFRPATNPKRQGSVLIALRRLVAAFAVAMVCEGRLCKSRSRIGSTLACCRPATTSDRLHVHY